MDEWLGLRESIDTEIQAYISSLVSALGGRGADEDGRYMLGDDALACLKDLRRWLRLYDDKANRLDVSSCLAKANLVTGDLLEILSLWREDLQEDRHFSKLSLACLELLVPLTWPLEKTEQQMTINHHRHIPYLQVAQVSYKHAILNHERIKVLRTVLRIGLPSMALPFSERSHRDHGIIKLILYFIRNVAIISLPPQQQANDVEDDISRSATIEAFHYQDVFHLMLTITSNIKEEFDSEDMVVLEILFHILKAVEPERLFLSDSQLRLNKAEELQFLLKKEAGMIRSYTKHAPTRHNRFGTMIWVKRGDDRVSTVSGQDVLKNDSRALARMDQTKRWKPQKSRQKPTDTPQNEVDIPVNLTSSAEKHLRTFTMEFLDAAFNPFFHHAHKAVESEAERVLPHHRRHFFYLISWFLRADRARRRVAKAVCRAGTQAVETEESPFSLIVSALTQELFITLNRFMQTSYDLHDWQDLKAGMRCYTQILLTVQEMSESSLQDDQDIAENILSRLFYEETTHERVVAIVRYYSNQDFGYLDACTELAHVHLRVLEQYSKQNVDMQVRVRRSARKTKQKGNNSETNSGPPNEQRRDEHQEREDVATAQRTTVERKFDFARFASKFMKQTCVDTFVKFASYYKELTPEQLKRVHRFLYRVAFKNAVSVMLFRVDIIMLIHKMVKGPDSFDPSSKEGKEWSDLACHLFKKLIKMLKERPSLFVELLFSKISTTVCFLEHGHDEPVTTGQHRAPAELEIKPGIEAGRQLAIVLSILRNQNQTFLTQWIKKVLSSAIGERQNWETEVALREASDIEMEMLHGEHGHNTPEAPLIVVKPDGEVGRKAMFKNNKLRLLMKILGFERLGTEDNIDAEWVISSSVTSKQLSGALEVIERFESDPTSFGDGVKAENLIRKVPKTLTRSTRQDEDSEDDNFIVGDDDLEQQFPPGGSAGVADKAPKGHSRKQKDDGDTLTEAEREARCSARQEAAAKKQQRIKTDLYVHESDDEDNEARDREFFAKEEERRKVQEMRVLKALQPGKASAGQMDSDDVDSNRMSTGKRKRKAGPKASGAPKRTRGLYSSPGSGEFATDIAGASSSEDLTTGVTKFVDTPVFTERALANQTESENESASLLEAEVGVSKEQASRLAASDDTDEEETSKVQVNVAKRRTRAGFVIDSDSE